MRKTYELSRERVLDQIDEYVVAYANDVGSFPNLGMLSRRFGTLVRRHFECSTEELIKGDPRFIINRVKSGATYVGSHNFDPG